MGNIAFNKDVNDLRLLQTGQDLNDLNQTNDNGFYYISTGVLNSPSEYSGLIVNAINGTCFQIVVTSSGILYCRSRVGNPLEWSTWKRYMVDGESTSISASYNVGNLNGGSDIYADLNGNVLLVSGYFRSTVEISSGTVIATVGTTTKRQVFASPVSDGGDGSRLKLSVSGLIVCERRILANQWYSFEFVTFVK